MMSRVPVRLDQKRRTEAGFYHASARTEIHSGGVSDGLFDFCTGRRVQASVRAGSRQVKDANVSFVGASARSRPARPSFSRVSLT